MTTDTEPLSRWRALVANRAGLWLPDADLAHLSELVQRRARELGCPDLESYLARRWAPDAWRDELRALAPALTIGETYFFRHLEQLRAFEQVALPACLQRNPRPVRVLSAGCASGEELYSLAILGRAAIGEDAARRLSLHGIDLSEEAVAQARQALYAPWSLRELPLAERQQYFDPLDGRCRLKQPWRQMATFEVRNMLEEDAAFWADAAFDVVLCRNVMIYFTEEARRTLLARFERVIAPGGFLFLGPSDAIGSTLEGFEIREHHGAYFYQRTASARRAPVRPPAPVAPAPPRAAPRPPSGPLDMWNLGPALLKFEQERYEDAAALLREAPASHTDAQLFLAAAVMNLGDMAEAEAICRRLDGPGGHFLLALCRDQQGDSQGAERHAQMACALDPLFSLPHLLLGFLAQRAGTHAAARDRLKTALALLQRERHERLLLFGGGFGRKALVDMCRKALEQSGGAA